MNQIYRTIWNAARGLWQVASELGSSSGKSRSRSVSQLVAGSLVIVSLGAQAELPSDGQIVAGAGSIGQHGAAMTIQQSSQNMAINWKSFSIGQDNSVRFVQPSASSAVLNRVTGNQVSEIRGKLSANGKVFLVNPNGVLFSQTAKVDVGALVASTLDISPSDFMAGNYQFSGTSSNAVINQGNIVAAEGGYVAMIAAKIINSGSISTPKGSTLMGAGSTVTLDLGGPVKLEVNQATLETYIEQGGAIKADGGFVYLTAKAADALTSSVINHTGLTQAQSLSTNDQGEIVLLGDMQSGQLKVAGTLDASAPNGGDGGFIETSAAKVQIADNTRVTTQAPSGQSGEWLIDPTDFTIHEGNDVKTDSGIGATTLSNNLNMGGITLETVATNTGSEQGDINVNAAVSWASNTTLTLNAHHDININAPITATGANAGLALNYGGYIQNSGTVAADTNYHVNAPVTLSGGSARFGVNGQGYTLLHNQADLDAAKDTSGNYYALGNDVTLTGTYSDSVLGNFSGTLAGLGHSVDGLVIEQTVTSSTTDVGFIGQQTGGVVRDMGLNDIRVTNHSTSSDSRTGGLVGYQNGTISHSYASGAVSGYQYVGGLVGRQNGGDISNSYASGAVTGDSYYVGGLVGRQNGGDISNSYASGAVSGSYEVGGLVGMQISGTISHSYASGAVSGYQYVGGLVGYQNSGTISHSYASGAVTGNSYYVGGLVGWQYLGNISDSYASGAVTGASLYVGGLVGYQYSGTISNSYASGAVTGTGDAVGGLVGYQYSGTISDSYASGAMVSGWSYVGGLVGYQNANVSNSYASGAVTGRSNYVGGLVGYQASGTISDSYASGAVSGYQYVGGLVGRQNGGDISNSYYATTNAVGDSINNGGEYSGNTFGTAATYDELTKPATFSGWDPNIWTFPTQTGSAAAGYGIALPYLTQVTAQSDRTLFSSGLGTQASPYQITNWTQLQNINYNSEVLTNSYYFELADSLDASSAGYLSSWTPLGSVTNAFNGHFDGQYHILADLNTASSISNAGLFGMTAAGAAIEKVGLTNATIQGTTNVGGLVGSNAGTISESFFSGAVQGSDLNIGGLVGENTGTIRNSYTSGTVTGISSGDNVGGLVGYNNTLPSNGTINTTYSTAQVTGTGSNMGGLIGYDEDVNASHVGNYFATTNSAGTSINDSGSSLGNYAGNFFGEAKTYEQLTQLNTFSGWDISAVGGDSRVWRIYAGHSTPLLRGFLTPMTVSTNSAASSQVYDGTTALQSLPNLQWSAVLDNNLLLGSGLALGSKNVGSQAIHVDYYSTQNGYDLIVDHSLSAYRVNVTPRALSSVSGITASDKVYDSTAVATLNVTQASITGVLGNDTVTVNSASGSFSDKNAAVGKTVSISGITLGGSDGGNYTLTDTTASTTASITPKALSAVSGITAADKVYDSTAVAPLNTQNAVFAGMVNGDSLNVGSASGSFSDKNAAAGKTVSISGITLAGSDSGNYSLTDTTASTTASITPRALSAVSGITASDKVYDGTAVAPLNTQNAVFAGMVSGDRLNVGSASGSFSDKNAAVGKTVSISGITLAGSDGGNYTLTGITASTTASITPKALSAVSGISAADKVYDGTAVATLNTQNAVFTGLLGSDQVTLSGSGQFRSANVGNRSVDLSGMSLAGASGSNYSLVGTNFSPVTAAITARPVRVSAQTATKQVNSPDPQFLYDADCGALTGNCGLVAGETLVGQLQRIAGEAAGRYQIGQGSVTNANNPNYDISFQSGLFRIVANSAPQQVDNTIAALERETTPAQAGVAPSIPAANNGVGDRNDASLNLRYVASVEQIPPGGRSGELYVVDTGIQLSGFAGTPDEQP